MRRAATTVATLTALSLLWLAAPASAQVTKLFNATHSLTGDCSVSLNDPVPDPGCPDGPHPPEGKLAEPSAVATDGSGLIYVINNNRSAGKELSYVDVFSPDGHFLTSVAQEVKNSEDLTSPGIAVDSTGHLYVYYEVGDASVTTKHLVRYDPTVYEPEAGEVEYGAPPVEIAPAPFGRDIVIEPGSEHLFYRADTSGRPLVELGPASAGVANEVLAESPLAFGGDPIAFDLPRGRLYFTGIVEKAVEGGPSELETVIEVVESEPPFALLETLDSSNLPPETLGMLDGYQPRFSLAVDEANGHLFTGDLLEDKKLYELDEDFEYIGAISKPPLENQRGPIAIDNSETSPNQGFLYVPSGAYPAGRLYAYEPVFEPDPPEVGALSVDGVTETEAVLRGEVNPEGIPARWEIQYTSQADFEAEGFAGAGTAGEGDLAASGEASAVQAPAFGLAPGTTYRFRVLAENECEPEGEPCVGEAQGTFTTFAADAQTGGCANAALRTGLSARLPDCRAYELVTPADTNGLLPEAPQSGPGGPKWPSLPATPAGGSVAFMAFGGLIPGMDATGGPTEIGDTYVSTRTGGGWSTEPKSPNGSQARLAYAGGLSADHGSLALEAVGPGSLLAGTERRSYVRRADGEFVLVGEGSIGTALTPAIHYVAPGGSHVLFGAGGDLSVAPPLEPGAPPEGTQAIYDRLPDGTLRVVSLLPGEMTPAKGATYLGASADGSAVAFGVDNPATSPLYLRLDNAETLAAAPAGATYAGLSAGGRYLFYLLAGDLYRFDASSEATEPVTETGDADPVNIGSAGTGAYFLSASALATGPNPEGAEPEGGAHNLYHWDEGTMGFVATVSERDAEGLIREVASYPVQNGLGLWLEGLDSPALLSSRTTTDGSTLLFESRADLTSEDPSGTAQVFRYDAGSAELLCLSCDPTGAPAGADSLLTGLFGEGGTPVAHQTALNQKSSVPNLSADGRRAFFETPERLVSRDNDGLIDVYEWEAQGKGNCAEPGGCLFLISSGQSGRGEHLFGVSASGDDVFILSSDLLTAADEDETPSVYDVRVGGGFPAPGQEPGECLGEACLPAAAAPEPATPASSTFRGPGNAGTGATRARSCRRPARRARALSRRARRVARASRRMNAGRRAPRARRRARGLARRAKRASRGAKRCRARQRAVRKASR